MERSRGRVVNALGHGDGVGDGEAVIDGVNGDSGGAEEGIFVLRAAKEDGEEARGKLGPGNPFAAQGRIELTFLQVVDDGDDFPSCSRPGSRSAFQPDSGPGECSRAIWLINDGGRKFGGIVRVGRPQRLLGNTSHLEGRGVELGTDVAEGNFTMDVVRRRANDGEAGGDVAVAERQVAGKRDGLHARKSGESALQLALERDELRILVISRTGGRDLKQREMGGFDTRVDVQEAIEALAKQARADQEHHRHRQSGTTRLEPKRRQRVPDAARTPR